MGSMASLRSHKPLLEETSPRFIRSIMVHKCMNGRAPGYLINKFTSRLELHDRNRNYTIEIHDIIKI